MVTIIGIDPGLNGAYAVWQDEKIIFVADLPRFRTQLNGYALVNSLKGFHADHAFIERVSARPKQGVTSVFTFGTAYGLILGVVQALAIPHTQVISSVWKKRFGLGGDKGRARELACRLHPEIVDELTRVKDHNRAEAVLLAHYGSEV